MPDISAAARAATSFSILSPRRAAPFGMARFCSLAGNTFDCAQLKMHFGNTKNLVPGATNLMLRNQESSDRMTSPPAVRSYI
ncbi:hypothetical protein [Noviherbaspirillum sp. ST9]|uniref:hypothetical protein n=1 Tax=Noviherbaspirillum sp. ST9 TaxID=3401606 RepID=UPI003B58803B